MVNKKAIYIIGTVFALLASTFVLAQADPAAFVRLLPDQIPWVSNTSIPPGGQSVVVYGDPRKSGPYITRVRLPANYRIPPHSHPEERVYTVISGEFYIGFGDTFDPTRLRAFPTGSVLVVPANASHFHWMKSGEAVVQISGVGPSGIEYIDHADDPRS